MSTAGKLIGFVGAYARTNVLVALEYRTSLVSQAIGMIVNHALWVAFWVLYFERFPVIQGWTLEDVIVLWASTIFSVGLVFGLMSNSMRLPALIAEGQLDYYLALPKDALLHVLISNFKVLHLIDLIFGPLLLVAMVDLTWTRVLVFFVATLLGAIVMASFFVIAGSLAFFLGHAEAVLHQANFALKAFIHYPLPIFEHRVQILLYTLIPAGFVSTLPVELVREFQLPTFLVLLGGALGFSTLAVLIFRAGLRRYESGNLIRMRA